MTLILFLALLLLSGAALMARATALMPSRTAQPRLLSARPASGPGVLTPPGPQPGLWRESPDLSFLSLI